MAKGLILNIDEIKVIQDYRAKKILEEKKIIEKEKEKAELEKQLNKKYSKKELIEFGKQYIEEINEHLRMELLNLENL